HAATTVSATMELAAAAGVSVFATGGLGGVHRGYAHTLDISSDLAAMTRFPIAVVSSGVKSILDVTSTREALETLGIPVVGYQTDRFPAFYQRDSAAGIDARFDDEASLARFVQSELARTNRAVLIANPIPAHDEIPLPTFNQWLAQAQQEAESRSISGRDATPFILGRLHQVSAGATLRANLSLVKSNARLAASIASRLA
ncbi:MAG: pseudouridine-5'-phosphate glycosidase, partial [Phycisphaerae bacterium]|nr:pseudouridine-5'-phosphate glycosidase [Phycisphaerae bacterium]